MHNMKGRLLEPPFHFGPDFFVSRTIGSTFSHLPSPPFKQESFGAILEWKGKNGIAAFRFDRSNVFAASTRCRSLVFLRIPLTAYPQNIRKPG